MAAGSIDFEVKKPAESVALAARSVTPMELLQQALSQGVSIEQLERLQAMYERDQAMIARRAFVEAMANFKAETIVILRDRTNKQYDSKYVSLGNLVNTVTPYLSKHGLSASWMIEQTSGIKVSCVLTHALGHTESVSMTAPPDTSGQKNPIQQIKSAITYAKGCTFESVCGLAGTDGNLDDDGNGSSPNASTPGLSDERFVSLRDGVANAGNTPELERLYRAACKEADTVNDQDAKRDFNKAKNQRYRELHDAGL